MTEWKGNHHSLKGLNENSLPQGSWEAEGSVVPTRHLPHGSAPVQCCEAPRTKGSVPPRALLGVPGLRRLWS